MKPQILLSILLLSSPCVSFLSAAGPQSPAPRIASKSRLGLPFKTQATVEAEIVRAEDVGQKDLAGQYLLRVSKVDGVELFPKQVFKFTTAAGVPSLPTDVFELYKQKTGKHVDELQQEEIRLAEKGFVGEKLTYLASEVESPPTPGEHKNGGRTPESTLLLNQLLDPK
jgi:hypothetical protein